MSPKETMYKCRTVEDFIEFTKNNPLVKIENIFSWAINDVNCCSRIQLINAFINADIIDVNHPACWDIYNDYDENEKKTTLLLTAAFHRDADLVSELLKIGADMNAKTEYMNFGILDNILMGRRCYSDIYFQDNVLQLLDIVLSYNPAMELHVVVFQFFKERDRPGFIKNENIRKFIKSCTCAQTSL